jgi:hypothetical protein
MKRVFGHLGWSALVVASIAVVTLTGSDVDARRNKDGDRGGRRASTANATKPAQPTDKHPDTLAQDDLPKDEAAKEEVEILALGDGSERFWVAFEHDRMSIWADHMPADQLLDLLREYGGPSYSCFEPMTRPVTMSFVRVRMEAVLRKMLVGYNFAYYYEDGVLAHLRVLNFIPGRQYKVADPIVRRIDWTQDVLNSPSN